MKHTLSVSFQNRYNAIPRITGLFSGRGFEIESISFGRGEQPGLTRMTITTRGDDETIEQITKQLHKLVDVTRVVDLTHEPFIERELALIKVSATHSTRSEIMHLATIFQGKIVDISPRSLTIEITGKEDKIDAALRMVHPFGLIEVARTGSVALKREFPTKK